jgi:16S rRNA pseudouridine516 synthase
LEEEDIRLFKEGIQLEQDWTTLPAELEILEAGEQSLARITIYEGKFHQIKRMFEAVGKPVLSLSRIAMGPLTLPDNLEEGDYRALTDQEYEALMKLKR